jgi:mono/diheme cytochrome c family protein
MFFNMIFIVAILVLVATSSAFGQSVENGKTIYDESCAVCHSIGKGRMVGPDLIGVAENRDKEWIFRFINNSAQMVAEGDGLAVALYEEYNNLPMPSHDFSESELEDLLAFINVASQDAMMAAATSPPEAEKMLPTTNIAVIPTWFLITASLIAIVIVFLLVVIFNLFRLVRRLDSLPSR